MFVTNIGVLALAIYFVSSSSHPWQCPSIDVLIHEYERSNRQRQSAYHRDVRLLHYPVH